MNVRRLFVRLVRIYFWLLVALVAITVGWLFSEYVIAPATLASGWFAVAGFGLLIVLFLFVLRRFATP